MDLNATSRPRYPLIHGAIVTLAFVLGIAACWALIPRSLSREYVPVFDEKRAYLLAHAGEFDTIFLGSSRVYRHFIPEQFDDAMRERGMPTHSFNFGIDGMVPPEIFFAADELLRLRPRVRCVLIELLPVNPKIPKENTGTVRALWWHDWQHTLMAGQAARRDPRWDLGEKFALSRMHAQLFVDLHASRGRGAGALSERLISRRVNRRANALHETRHAVEWIGANGFVPMSRGPLSESDATLYRSKLEAYRLTASDGLLPQDVRARLRQLAAGIRAIGARPVFVITPAPDPRERVTDLRAQGVDADLIALNDPGTFPSLFDPAFLADNSHLTAAGAREFTRALAAEFAKLGRAAETPSHREP